MSQLYDELVKLDKAIANRWKARSRDDPKRKLGPADAKAILQPLLMPDYKITESESKAIVKLVLDGAWTDQGLAIIQVSVKIGVEAGLFQNGGEPLVTPDELRPITNALGAAMTGKIAFKSPGTFLSYVPGHYQVIQELVSQTRILAAIAKKTP